MRPGSGGDVGTTVRHTVADQADAPGISGLHTALCGALEDLGRGSGVRLRGDRGEHDGQTGGQTGGQTDRRRPFADPCGRTLELVELREA